MNEIHLTKTQLQQLALIVEKFPDIEEFTLRTESTSGIGPTTFLSFALWDENRNNKVDIKVDITDFSNW